MWDAGYLWRDGSLNITMLPYHFRKSHCDDKTASQHCYLLKWDSSTHKDCFYVETGTWIFSRSQISSAVRPVLSAGTTWVSMDLQTHCGDTGWPLIPHTNPFGMFNPVLWKQKLYKFNVHNKNIPVSVWSITPRRIAIGLWKLNALLATFAKYILVLDVIELLKADAF